MLIVSGLPSCLRLEECRNPNYVDHDVENCIHYTLGQHEVSQY